VVAGDGVENAGLRALVLGANVFQIQICIEDKDLGEKQIKWLAGIRSLSVDSYLARLRTSVVYQPVLVQFVELLEILERHTALLGASSLADALVRHLRRGAQVDDEIRLHVNGLLNELVPLLQRIEHALLQGSIASHVLHKAVAESAPKISDSGQTGQTGIMHSPRAKNGALHYF